MMNRVEYGKLIQAKLEAHASQLHDEFMQPGRVETCVIDDLLPEDVAREIYASFPDKSEMTLKKSLREHKHIAAQMNQYKPLLEEIVYGFQEPGVVKIVSEICGLKDAHPDSHLYAGGISLMAQDNFLNPHLDNSHDKNRDMYRILNLLYYVTPDWKQENGGNLELWDNGPEGQPREIFSKFNRLALMATHKHSWHSVNQVKFDGSRCCVSNYYFSPVPMEREDYFHVTSFRGRPEQPVRDLVLQADGVMRQSIRKVFKKGIVENPHVYKKEEAEKEKVH